MTKTVKTVFFWFVIGVSALALWEVVKAGPPDQGIPEISYSQFMSDVDSGEVARVTISGTKVRAEYHAEGKPFRVVAPHSQEAMLTALRSKGVEIWFKDSDTESSWPLQLLGTWAPLLLLGALWFFMIRQMRRAAMIQKQGANVGVNDGLR